MYKRQQQEGVESVSQEEVRRFGLNQSLSAAAAGRVIAELEARGMLVAMPQPEERGRGRPSPRWSVDRAAVGKSENRKIDDGPGDGPPDRRRGTVEFEMPEIETAADLRPALKALTRQTAEGKLTPGECHKMSSVVRTHASIIETVELEPRIAEIKKAIEQDRKLRKALQGIAEQSRAKAAPPPS